MKILITGSKGTIGKPLQQALEIKYPTQILGIDLFHRPEDNKYMRCDISQYRQLEQVFEKWGGEICYVYHLAAEFGRLNGEQYYENLWLTNVIGTRHLLEMQQRYGFKLIFTSSSEIYGESPIFPLTEDLSEKYPLRQLNDYAITKWVNEQQIMNCESRHGIQAMRLRLFNGYGPGEYYTPYRSVVCLFCYRALHGLPYTVFKDYYRPFMYIDDLISTLANCVETFFPGEVINIGGSELEGVEFLNQLILDKTRTNSEITYLDKDEHNVCDKGVDIGKAIRLLRHNPKISLSDGIENTINWMRKVYANTIHQ